MDERVQMSKKRKLTQNTYVMNNTITKINNNKTDSDSNKTDSDTKSNNNIIYNTNINYDKKMNEKFKSINELILKINKLEREIIMNDKYPQEFIWEFTTHKRYINTGNKIIIYHEPDMSTFLNKFIENNQRFIVTTIYCENGVRWFKLSDGRGWIIK